MVHCLDPELELAAAEAWGFTGSEPQGRLVHAPVAVDIARAAYLGVCLSLEARGQTVEALVQEMRNLGIKYEGFHLEVLRPPPRVNLDSQALTVLVANAVEGRPNLRNPRVQLAVLATEEGFLFGRIISRGLNRWLAGMKRPVHFSSALPQRFSRALVNLVASPGDTLIDPCCGIGTPVIEAAEAGIIAIGADSNPKMLRALAENLRHLGLPLRLYRGDARQLIGQYDAAVVDLPYGRNLPASRDAYRAILAPLREAARRVAVVSARPLRDLLEDELGFRCLRVATVAKGQLVRHVYVLSAQP